MIESYMKGFHMKNKLIILINVLYLVFFIAGNSFSEDFLDRLMERCSKGDMKACDELDKLTEKYKSQIDRLNEQADKFQTDAPSLKLDNNGHSDFKKAYLIILERYLKSDAAEPVHKRHGINQKSIGICSNHFHELFYKYGKTIPKTESGSTDWGMIYIMTIEHYFRFCSNKVE